MDDHRKLHELRKREQTAAVSTYQTSLVGKMINEGRQESKAGYQILFYELFTSSNLLVRHRYYWLFNPPNRGKSSRLAKPQRLRLTSEARSLLKLVGNTYQFPHGPSPVICALPSSHHTMYSAPCLLLSLSLSLCLFVRLLGCLLGLLACLFVCRSLGIIYRSYRALILGLLGPT